MVTAAPRGQSARHLGQTRDHSGPPSHQSPGRVLKGATCENTLPKERRAPRGRHKQGATLAHDPATQLWPVTWGRKLLDGYTVEGWPQPGPCWPDGALAGTAAHRTLPRPEAGGRRQEVRPSSFGRDRSVPHSGAGCWA